MNTPSEIPDPDAALAALVTCRRAMIGVLRTVTPMGVSYHGASMVVAAIDGMGTVLTGRLDPFAIGGTVGPGRAMELLARQREADEAGTARPKPG